MVETCGCKLRNDGHCLVDKADIDEHITPMNCSTSISPRIDLGTPILSVNFSIPIFKSTSTFYLLDSFLPKEKAKHDEDVFKKTKSRELKKVKQPISPGGRLSSFLNSLFTNGKKLAKNDHHHHEEERKLKSPNNNASTNCSSFSKSCLRKNIISTGPCGHIKNLDMDQQNVEPRKAIKRNYIYEGHQQIKFDKNIEVEVEDDNNAISCTSSDLFELDIFSSIELMGLPVYETTNLASQAMWLEQRTPDFKSDEDSPIVSVLVRLGFDKVKEQMVKVAAYVERWRLELTNLN
ncbi:hypothetical protein HAX54_030061 [Datura stramonium]|uniref:Uncharacterized protein n=1 Tax=Datura stramonium TaxID=4076 RepID=A0ABS8SAQ1_DATST|nr:hypothetical protein [Datura stramonium]